MSTLVSALRVLTVGQPVGIVVDHSADEVLAWLAANTSRPLTAGVQALFPTPGVEIVLVGRVKGNRVRLHPVLTRWIERKMIVNLYATVESLGPGRSRLRGRIWVGWPFLVWLAMWLAWECFAVGRGSFSAGLSLILLLAFVYLVLGSGAAAKTIQVEVSRRIRDGLAG